MAIKKLVCESCGGQLIIDQMKQNYTCQFCGVTYDYEYFKEDDIHTKAEYYLRRREFEAAREALEFLLKKEPSNSYARQKLLLAHYHLRDVEDIVKTDVRLWHKADPDKTDSIVSGRGELTKLRELIDSRLRAMESDLKIEELDSTIDSEETRLRNFNELATGYYSGRTGKLLTISAIRKKYILIEVIVFFVIFIWFMAAGVSGLFYHSEAVAFRSAEDGSKNREELIKSLEWHREERSALKEGSDSIKERFLREVKDLSSKASN